MFRAPFTFALGTSAGDLVAEKMALGSWVSAIFFGLAIVLNPREA